MTSTKKAKLDLAALLKEAEERAAKRSEEQRAFQALLDAAPRTMQALAQRLLGELRDASRIKIDASSLCALHRLANGSTEDAVIFENRGGQPFHVWTDESAHSIRKSKDFKQFMYAVRIGSEERVVSVPHFARKQHYLYWYPLERRNG